MTHNRYLGAAWAAVHGPADPGDLAAWTLESGFAGILPGPAPRPVDWRSVTRAARRRSLPFDLAGTLRLAAHDAVLDRADAGLGSRHDGDRTAAFTAIAGGAETAERLGLSRLVLEPGCVALPGEPGPVDLSDGSLTWTGDLARSQAVRRNAGFEAALDGACRALYRLCKRFPEKIFCLGPSAHIAGLGTLDGLTAIFEDLKGYPLAYWHDAAIAVRRQQVLGEDQGAWLDRFAGRTAGITLSDAADGPLRQPPGAGLVDYPLLASYMSPVMAGIPFVVELDPGVPTQEIVGLHSFLSKFGL